MSTITWTPYDSLTKAPTNLKEAIDWVLRVTGRDGKENDPVAAASPPSTDNPPHCLCYLAKAVKDLLYDARSPGSPGPSQQRYWDTLLLGQEKDIVNPVLQDLGLLNGGSTRDTCAGGTEVIGTLIDQLALGLQKWVGWQDGEECCLGQKNGASKGIGKACKPGSGGDDICCRNGNRAACASHECDHCGLTPSCTICGTSADKKCYLSAYKRHDGNPSDTPKGEYYWPTISSDSEKVHLLARIFLGSVCLIWSGLSQLGFLTGGNSGRWKKSSLHEIGKDMSGLGSFMAAMGYDLDRLNQEGSAGPGQQGKTGSEVAGMLTGAIKDLKEGTDKNSVAEYYSSIYSTVEKENRKETLCRQYPLLVLHILASGYFRAGSAGANKVTPAKPAPSAAPSPTTDTTKKEKSPRKPRTIREILYWLSALPYSEKYKALVERMEEKYPRKEGNLKEPADDIKLYDDKNASSVSTTLQRKDITHYLMAACGYCPLVLIGIQGTIATSGNDTTSTTQGQKKAESCSNNVKRKEEKTDCNKKELAEKGKVCYGGYHLEVSKFGPLHGMYANGLYGFDMGGSAAQCLDQLRVYVYHCFYQLYFLRKQCTVGVEAGVGAGVKTVLGWKSCRYGFQVAKKSGKVTETWQCTPLVSGGTSGGDGQNKCTCLGQGASQHTGGSTGDGSPLQSFLCDSLGSIKCKLTTGVSSLENYPEILEHMNKIVTPSGEVKGPHREYPQICPVPMGWSKDGNEKHFKDLNTGSHKQAPLDPAAGTGSPGTYPAHCTGNTLSHLLEYYCDPVKEHGTLVLVLRLLACITPTVPRTLGDLFGFYYYIVYIGGNSKGGQEVHGKLTKELTDVRLSMLGGGPDAVVNAIQWWSEGDGSGSSTGGCSHTTVRNGSLKTLFGCGNSGGTGQCCPYISPLSGQQYGQLSPAMAGTYLSWLVYLIEKFEEGLKGLEEEFKKVDCKGDGCKNGTKQCTNECHKPTGGKQCECCCDSVVSCTGVLPVLYRHGFGYGNVTELHKGPKKCHEFLTTLKGVLEGDHLKKDGSKGHLHHEINQLIYTTRLPWIFVLTLAWLMAVLYLAFGAIWPLDWTHMRSHCRGWFRKGSLSPWEVLMVGKKKGRGILELFGGTQNKKCHDFLTTLKSVLKGDHLKNGSPTGLHHEINQLIYTTRLPWIFVLTLAWLVAVLYLAFGAIWPLDWTHMRSHCRGWFRKGSLSPWEVLMVGKKKGRGILEFFGNEGKGVVGSAASGYRWVTWVVAVVVGVGIIAGGIVGAVMGNGNSNQNGHLKWMGPLVGGIVLVVLIVSILAVLFRGNKLQTMLSI